MERVKQWFLLQMRKQERIFFINLKINRMIGNLKKKKKLLFYSVCIACHLFKVKF